ncbi:polysaccharide biosynthesis C-terminal domain-containing protein [bacterium RCC_150]
MAFAASGVVVGILDNPFLARSIRITDRRFERERRTRTTTALGLLILGLLLVNVNYVVGFSIVIGGGEMALNALKSAFLRSGTVDRVMLLDLIRQAVSIAAGASYLFLVPNPNVMTATVLYAVSYMVAAIFGVFKYGIGVPSIPGKLKDSVVLSLGALAGAGYAQGDVLFLGIVAGQEAAGTYSIASLVAWAAAGLFLNHASSHVEDLRTGGRGARLAGILMPAAFVAILVLLVGVLLTWLQLMNPLGPTLAILSIFVVFRSMNHVCTVALTVAGRDMTRMLATVVTALVDLVMVFVLSGLGSTGAAIAAGFSELILCAVYLRAFSQISASIESRSGAYV